jgi:hypothetical protein
MKPENAGATMKIVTLMLLLPGVALAAETTLQQCRIIADPAARLACYDALPVFVAPAPAPSQVPVPGSAQTPAMPGSPQAAVHETPGQFGLGREVPVVELASIESTIPGHFDGWYPDRRVRLANGQVWQVADGSTRLYDLDNPKVTIRRGVLGAFYLDLSVDNRSIRVRRVQ